MATKFNGFVNSKTLSEALTSSATDGKLYFPTDSDAIIENGKMHGGGRLLSHSWSGFVRSSTSASGSDFVLFRVVPLDTTRCWTVKFELNGYYNSSYQQQHIIEITGFGGSTPNIHATTFNNSTSPTDTSVFNQLITYTKAADAYVGIGTSNVVSYSSSRTVRITLLDYSNCSVTLNDAPANTDYSTYATGRTRTACNIYAKGETTYNGFTIGSLGISNNYLQTSGSYLAASSVSVGSADKLDGYHATGLLENLSNSGNNISIKVGGTTKTLTPAYATSSSKLSTARTINGVSFDGSKNVTGAFTDGLYESYIKWGGQNLGNEMSPFDAAIFQNANRFAFMNPNAITVEYSIDSGTTWSDYGATDAQKTAVFTYGVSDSVVFKIGKSTTKTEHEKKLLRITIEPKVANIYCQLRKFAILLGTYGSDGCYLDIDGATNGAPTTWVKLLDHMLVGGWEGWNIVNTDITTYWASNTGQYKYIRFTFGCTSTRSGTTATGLCVRNILGFSEQCWSYGSTMGTFNRPYTINAYKQVTFPAQLTATSLVKSGGTSSQFLKADGSVDSNSYAPKATTLSGYGITDGVNTVTTNGSGNAVTTASVSGHTLTLTKGTTFLTSHQDISGKSNTSHTHSVKINGVTKTIAASGGTAVDLGTYLTSHQDLSAYAKTTDVDTKLATKAASSHTHDDRYFTETEVINLVKAEITSALEVSKVMSYTGTFDPSTGMITSLVSAWDGNEYIAVGYSLLNDVIWSEIGESSYVGMLFMASTSGTWDGSTYGMGDSILLTAAPDEEETMPKYITLQTNVESRIAKNTADIATNKANIATNTANIETLKGYHNTPTYELTTSGDYDYLYNFRILELTRTNTNLPASCAFRCEIKAVDMAMLTRVIEGTLITDGSTCKLLFKCLSNPDDGLGGLDYDITNNILWVIEGNNEEDSYAYTIKTTILSQFNCTATLTMLDEGSGSSETTYPFSSDASICEDNHGIVGLTITRYGGTTLPNYETWDQSYYNAIKTAMQRNQPISIICKATRSAEFGTTYHVVKIEEGKEEEDPGVGNYRYYYKLYSYDGRYYMVWSETYYE